MTMVSKELQEKVYIRTIKNELKPLREALKNIGKDLRKVDSEHDYSHLMSDADALLVHAETIYEFAEKVNSLNTANKH